MVENEICHSCRIVDVMKDHTKFDHRHKVPSGVSVAASAKLVPSSHVQVADRLHARSYSGVTGDETHVESDTSR